jgi:hypothetical protein
MAEPDNTDKLKPNGNGTTANGGSLLREGADPSIIIPLAAARANLMHWWREPVAGLASLSIGCFDAWFYGRDSGLTSSLDELLVVGGVVLIAGSKKLFSGEAMPGAK